MYNFNMWGNIETYIFLVQLYSYNELYNIVQLGHLSNIVYSQFVVNYSVYIMYE